MLLDGFYPSDIRVQKEATALIKAGFKVSLLCKRRAGEEYFAEEEGIQLMRIDAGTTNFGKGIYDILLAVNFIHPVFKKGLNRFINKFSPDVLHAHDLPLVKTAYKAARRNNLPVVADFHENYPEALKVWFQWRKNPVIRLKNQIFFSYTRWHTYERWAVHNADKIIAVVEEMRDRLIRDHKLSPDKIVVVSNTENKSFVAARLDTSIYGADKDKFVVAYTGGVGPHRGVDTLIEAMGRLKDKEDIVLYITGNASKAAIATMREAIAKYDVADKVRILGYRPFDQFYSFMKMAKINVIPHHSNGHTDNTVPHKLFQCMMTGNPLLVSTSAPLKRIVSESESGLIFAAGNAEDLANKIVQLYDNEGLRKELGENGLNATLKGSYNWETVGQSLVTLYQNLKITT